MYAFVHIDKTAGTTLTSILRRSFGTQHCDIRLPLFKRRDDGHNHRGCIEAADLRRVRRIYGRLRGISGHNVKPYSDLDSECPKIRYFTILRDPSARFRSHFLNRAPNHTLKGFEAWISDETNRDWQTRMIAGEASAQKAIELIESRFGFVGFTERFDEALVLIGQWLGVGFRPEYMRLNQLSGKRRPRDMAREKCDLSYLEDFRVAAQIREANREDQIVYDYIATTVYPRLIAAFRGDFGRAVCDFQRRNQKVHIRKESARSRFVRNYVYKPLLHCYAM